MFNEQKFSKAIVAFVKKMEQHKPQTYEYSNLQIEAPYAVFPSYIGNISSVFLNEIVVNIKNSTVLDLGTGNGIYSLICAKNGNKVTGVDISERAIETAKLNAKKNQLNNIQFQTSNIYSSLNGQKFDYIIANLPFTQSKYCKKVKASIYYSCICMNENNFKSFILEAPNYLTPTGKVYFTYGTSGNFDLLKKLVTQTPYSLKIKKEINREASGEILMILEISK